MILDDCLRVYNSAFDARAAFRMEYRLQRADSSYRWILDTGVPRYDDAGCFAGYIGSALDITERKQIEQSLLDNQVALRRSYERNQDLAGRLINAQEAERTRIARDLHDDLSQQLAGFGIMLSGLKRDLNSSALRGELLATVDALQEQTSTLAHGISVTFSAQEDLASLDFGTALCLYRVTQEALANVVRHARANAARVELRRSDGNVELSIVDDGMGFVASERTGSGLGLRSIDERVRLVRGVLTLESQPGRGTNLRVRIPVSSAELVRD